MNPTPYRHAADRIVSRIAVPVLREPVFFCFMLLTFVWPQLTSDLFRIEATHWEILGLYIAYAYAATLPLGILGGKARRWYKAAAYTLAYAVSMAECFLLVFFRTFITPSLMSIATDTDPAESAEFIECYLFTGRFALFLAAWSLVAGINLLLEKVSQARRTAPMPHAGLRTCLLTTVLAGGGIFGLTSNASAFESAWRLSRIHDRHELHELLREDPELCLERRSAPERLFFSLRMQAFDRNAIGSLHEAMESIAIDSCTFRSPEIVLILGESYNKHHAALYGYPLPTTPRLSQEEAAGRLYPFTDVVSPANFTVKAMHLLFSFASQDRQTAWCDTPLFPALFRRAGYDTLMFDNQTTFTLENDDVWDQEIRHFLYHPRLSPQLFTHCNADKYPFDEGLLADFDRQDLRFRNPHRLTIFHLMGQHVAYRNRFPAEAGYFTADSIPEYSTSGLRRSRDERRIVADYDNAVRYNDRVVGEILDRCRTRDAVVVYLSDHGEEVFDYAHRNGRLLPSPIRDSLHDLDVGPLSGRTSRTRGGDRPCGRPALHDRRPAAPAARSGQPLLPLVRPDAQRRQRPFRCLAPPIAARRQGGLRPHHAAGEGQCGNEQGCLIHSQTPLSISLRNRRIARRRSIFPPRRNGSPRPNAVWVQTTSSWAA